MFKIVCLYMFVYTHMCLRTCICMFTVHKHIYVPDTLLLITALGSLTSDIHHHHHHHHKHQGLDPLIRSVSTITTNFSNVSSVFQLSSFLVVCSSMMSKGFGFVAFFASAETSSVCIHLSCLICL